MSSMSNTWPKPSRPPPSVHLPHITEFCTRRERTWFWGYLTTISICSEKAGILWILEYVATCITQHCTCTHACMWNLANSTYDSPSLAHFVLSCLSRKHLYIFSPKPGLKHDQQYVSDPASELYMPEKKGHKQIAIKKYHTVPGPALFLWMLQSTSPHPPCGSS